MPANCVKGRERGKGESEEWPTEYTDYTERGEGGGRDPETLPANYAEGREWRKGDSEEWPTEHTEYTERGGERWEPRKRKGAEFI